MYAKHGDMWIALETGASRGTVRKRREDLGIMSMPPGRRRGVPLTAVPSARAAQSPFDGLTRAERALIDRYRADRRAAATEDLLVTRLRAAHDAKTAGDDLAYEDAMLAISTAAARIAEHSRTLRMAA